MKAGEITHKVIWMHFWSAVYFEGDNHICVVILVIVAIEIIIVVGATPTTTTIKIK